jgi:hypothetical protein
MSFSEALNLIKQVCAEYKGTLKEHQILQQAIYVIEDENKKEVPQEKKIEVRE